MVANPIFKHDNWSLFETVSQLTNSYGASMIGSVSAEYFDTHTSSFLGFIFQKVLVFGEQEEKRQFPLLDFCLF